MILWCFGTLSNVVLWLSLSIREQTLTYHRTSNHNGSQWMLNYYINFHQHIFRFLHWIWFWHSFAHDHTSHKRKIRVISNPFTMRDEWMVGWITLLRFQFVSCCGLLWAECVCVVTFLEYVFFFFGVFVLSVWDILHYDMLALLCMEENRAKKFRRKMTWSIFFFIIMGNLYMCVCVCAREYGLWKRMTEWMKEWMDGWWWWWIK